MTRDEPDRPPSLDLTDLGPDRWRGQMRPAQDAPKVRRLVWFGGGAVILLIAGINLAHPVAMAAAYVGGFGMLCITAWNLTGLMNLPLTLQLDPTHLEVGEDRFPLESIDRADATDGPVKLVLVLRDGTRRVWIASEDHHNHDDLAWLADTINERVAGR